MNHYSGNITPGKDIIPDNIWFSEEWSKAVHNRRSCEQEVPLDAGASRGMVQRIGKERGKDGWRQGIPAISKKHTLISQCCTFAP